MYIPELDVRPDYLNRKAHSVLDVKLQSMQEQGECTEAQVPPYIDRKSFGPTVYPSGNHSSSPLWKDCMIDADGPHPFITDAKSFKVLKITCSVSSSVLG